MSIEMSFGPFWSEFTFAFLDAGADWWRQLCEHCLGADQHERVSPAELIPAGASSCQLLLSEKQDGTRGEGRVNELSHLEALSPAARANSPLRLNPLALERTNSPNGQVVCLAMGSKPFHCAVTRTSRIRIYRAPSCYALAGRAGGRVAAQEGLR